MAKKKMLKSLAEVDQALNEIAELNSLHESIAAGAKDRENALLDAQTQKAINDIRIQCSSNQEPVEKQIGELKDAIADYLVKFKDMIFNSAKSVNLTCGQVGYGESKSIDTSAKTVEKLKTAGLQQCVKTTESVRKDVLAKMGDDILKSVGAKRIVTDRYFYKLQDGEKITIREIVR